MSKEVKDLDKGLRFGGHSYHKITCYKAKFQKIAAQMLIQSAFLMIPVEPQVIEWTEIGMLGKESTCVVEL